MVIIWYFITSCDGHLSHCAYTIAVCSVFNIMLQVFVFYQKQNVWALMSFWKQCFWKLAINKWICRKNCEYFLAGITPKLKIKKIFLSFKKVFTPYGLFIWSCSNSNLLFRSLKLLFKTYFFSNDSILLQLHSFL